MPGPDRQKPVLWVIAAGLAALVALAAAVAWRAGGEARERPATPAADGPRIVALSPALAIILRDLGLADRIVGRHGYDFVLDKAIPVCGDQAGLDYENLLRARPTHIVLEWGSRELPPRLGALAQERGWRIANYAMLTLDDVVRATEGLSAMFGVESPAVVSRMREAWTARPGRYAAAGRILMLEAIDPPAALGPGSFHHQILERLGAAFAITEGRPFMVLDAEEVQRLAPDAVIIFAPRPMGAEPGPTPSAEELRERLGRIGRLDVPAVRNSRIAVIDDPLCLTPSTALLGVTEELEQVLQGWAGAATGR